MRGLRTTKERSERFFGGAFVGLRANEANKIKAISFAAYRALVDLFPASAEVAKFTTLMTSLGFDSSDLSVDTTTPQGIGNVVCNAVLAFRHQDGSNQLGDLHAGAYSDYTGYQAANTSTTISHPNRWQPLSVPDGNGGFKIQTYTGPHWGRGTPFALREGSEIRPKRPLARYYFERPTRGLPLLRMKAYEDQAKELVRISSALTDRQKMMAEYWADGPNTEFPPGHWCLISQFVSHRDHHSLDDDAKLFFAVGNASWMRGSRVGMPSALMTRCDRSLRFVISFKAKRL